VLDVSGVACLTDTPQSAVLRVDGAADVLLDTGENDSDDWLHRNDSYIRNIRTSSITHMANPNTMETGISNWFSPCASLFRAVFLCKN